MNEFVITLKKEELDIVMRALGELPLKDSLPVFNTINTQFIQQAKDKEKGAE